MNIVRKPFKQQFQMTLGKTRRWPVAGWNLKRGETVAFACMLSTFLLLCLVFHGELLIQVVIEHVACTLDGGAFRQIVS